MTEKKIKSIVITVIIAFIALILLLAGITVVPSGHTGVVVRMGKVTGETLSDGTHLKMPFITTVIKMDNQIQKNEVETSAVSKDLQTVTASVAVNYHLSTESSAEVYKTMGLNYIDKILSPAIHEATKAVMAKYSAEELITQRGTVSIEIHDLLLSKVSTYGIYIDEFNIVNFDFSAEFNAAIEAKQVAEQNKIKANTLKEQRVIEAEAAASEKTIAANAEAEAIKAKAEAEAEAIKVKADAEAEANAKISASLNANVLENKAIEKWNGEYPEVMSGESASVIIGIGERKDKTPQESINNAENNTPVE